MRSAVLVMSACLLATSASARVDLSATRLAFEKPDATYSRSDTANLVLSYRPSGDPIVLRDVRVDVEIRTSPVTRVPYRIREIDVSRGDREFVMPLDLTALGVRDGTYVVTATIDGNDAFGETDEDNNQARTSVTVGRPPVASAPAPSAAQSIRPTSAHVIAATTCSAFERQWSSPLEVGWHPGYGHASVVLAFAHPVGLLRSGETVRSAALVLQGDMVGRPMTELGSLGATVRTKAVRGAACSRLRDAQLTLTTFDGSGRLDLTRAMRDAEALTDDCAATLEIVLSFPESRLEPEGGSLLRLAADGATLDVETARR